MLGEARKGGIHSALLMGAERARLAACHGDVELLRCPREAPVNGGVLKIGESDALHRDLLAIDRLLSIRVPAIGG